jgi:uncharacterized protein
MTESQSAPTRYAALDLLRGVAILGTLGTNVWIFTDPAGLVGYLDGAADPSASPLWAGVEAVLQSLTQGKFLGLLSLLFGIGLELQRRAAVRSGRAWPGPYPVRAGLLFVDGVLHYLLVVEFDVLMGYAVTSLVVAYVLASSDRVQRRWLLASAIVHLGLLALLTGLLLRYPFATGGTDVRRPNPYADGSWSDLVRFRIDNAAAFRLEPVFILALSVGMFLLGARLVRSGLLEHSPDHLGQSGARLRRRLLALGAIALPVDLALGLSGGSAGLVLSRYGTAALVALGLLAAGVELAQRRPRPGRVQRLLAGVGRTALSCYVLQNLVASALCYGWGLGLATQLPPQLRVPGTVLTYLAVVAVVTLFANLWLRRYPRGPVELVWAWTYRALTPRRVVRAVARDGADVGRE